MWDATVKLAAWRRNKGWTQEQLASELGVSQPYISQIERSSDPYVPSRELMVRIYALTGGDVEPNDFYELPSLAEPQLVAAA